MDERITGKVPLIASLECPETVTVEVDLSTYLDF